MNLLEKDFEGVISCLREISSSASDLIMEVYNSDFKHSLKADKSPVTIADIESNKIINDRLKKEFPQKPIVSEQNLSNEIKENKNFFLVDPLDGTKEFLKKNGEFTVNIAYVRDLTPILGVVQLPVTGVQYFSNGFESFKFDENNFENKKLRKIFATKNTNQIRILVSRSHLDSKTDSFIKKIEKPIIMRRGSSLKFCLIAEGLADIYVRFGRTMEWDIAAGNAILNTSGCSIFDLNLNKIVYGKADFANPSFIAIANHLKKNLLEFSKLL